MSAALILALPLSAFLAAGVPGMTNPDVTQANIDTTICVPGWTKTIRPPASYTDKLKRQQMAARHLTADPSAFEEDHLVSLEIGGNPTSPANLWPQPWNGPYGAHRKDRLENRLKSLVCAHRLKLIDAQHAIATDWVGAYRKYVGPLP